MKKICLILAIAILFITVPMCGLAANISRTVYKPVTVTDLNIGTTANESIAAYRMDFDLEIYENEIGSFMGGGYSAATITGKACGLRKSFPFYPSFSVSPKFIPQQITGIDFIVGGSSFSISVTWSETATKQTASANPDDYIYSADYQEFDLASYQFPITFNPK